MATAMAIMEIIRAAEEAERPRKGENSVEKKNHSKTIMRGTKKKKKKKKEKGGKTGKTTPTITKRVFEMSN
jgi:hypothetical protein